MAAATLSAAAQPGLRAGLEAVYAGYRAFLVEHRPIAAALQGDARGLGRLDPGYADGEWFDRFEAPALDALDAALCPLEAVVDATTPPTEALLARVLRGRIDAARLDPVLTLRAVRPDLAFDWASEALDLLLGWPSVSAAARRRLLVSYTDALVDLLRAWSLRAGRTVLPAVFRRLGLDAATDLFALYRDHAAPRLGGVSATLRGALAALRTALRAASVTTEGFRCGGAPIAALLRIEGLSTDPRALLDDALTRLDEEADALVAAASRVRPGLGVRRVMAELALDHAPPRRLLASTRACVTELSAWVQDADLVTLPPSPPVRVAAAPAYLRALAAACLDVPGPWRTVAGQGGGACFYLASPRPTDPPEVAQATARAFHRARLAWVSAHETYPGHLVEHLHRPRAAHEAFQIADSEVFIEGWAHYAEGLLVSHGFRGGDPAIALGVAWARVLRRLRMVAALRLHAGDTPPAVVEGMFRRTGFVSPGEARRETLRAIFEPSVFTYSLGRDLIEARREAALRGPGATLRAFHDALLGVGTVPLGLRPPDAAVTIG